jgi:hypothetical protein
MKYLPFLLTAFGAKNLNSSYEQQESEEPIDLAKVEKEKRDKEILASMNQYIEALNTDNRELLSKLSKHKFMANSKRVEVSGSYITRGRPQSYYLDEPRNKSSIVHEKIWNPKVSSNDQLASVWAEYGFHIEGKFFHCGVNAFTFIKEEGIWKVVSANWTIQKSNCDP